MVERSSPVQLLEGAGRGASLADSEWATLVGAWLDGAATDAQMVVALMRAESGGLPPGARARIVEELVTRGERLDLTPLGATGTIASAGVADPIELAVPPICAALDVSVCVVGARGRGPVLGTLDKLQAVFGLQTELPAARVAGLGREAGVAVVGPSRRFGPGISRLESVLEQTGLGSRGEIDGLAVAARLLLSGAGSGVVAVSPERQDEMAGLLAPIADDWGRTVAVLSDDSTLARPAVVGAALEMAAAGGIVSGGGDLELRARVARLAGALCEAAGLAPPGEGAREAMSALDDGRALGAAEQWIEAQGGDPTVWTDPGRLPEAPIRREATAELGGVVVSVDSDELGEIARWVGAGRLHSSQAVDPAAGVELLAGVGSEVEPDEPIAVVHCRDAWQAEQAAAMLRGVIRIASGPDAADA